MLTMTWACNLISLGITFSLCKTAGSQSELVSPPFSFFPVITLSRPSLPQQEAHFPSPTFLLPHHPILSEPFLSVPSPLMPSSTATSPCVHWPLAESIPHLPVCGGQLFAGCEGVAGTCNGPGVPGGCYSAVSAGSRAEPRQRKDCLMNTFYMTRVSEQEAYSNH